MTTTHRAKALTSALQAPEQARGLLGPYGRLAEDVAALARAYPGHVEAGLVRLGLDPGAEAIMRWLSERVSPRITPAYERRQAEMQAVRDRRAALRSEIARRDAAVRHIRTAGEIMADLGRPTCGIKYPGQPWSAVRWVGDLRETAARIEDGYQPGYTDRPYVQLVRRDLLRNCTMRVVSEWEPTRRRWTDHWTAAGFLPRSV